ncbi:MAG: hypothetical protein RBT59_07375 [Arcobacteraceae bacterium]|jgi:hypothetical protein|nr:hypothetical protein [Arcobacteraceae bacterium]
MSFLDFFKKKPEVTQPTAIDRAIGAATNKYKSVANFVSKTANQFANRVSTNLNLNTYSPGITDKWQSNINQGINRVKTSFQENPQQYNFFNQLSQGNINSGVKPIDYSGKMVGNILDGYTNTLRNAAYDTLKYGVKNSPPYELYRSITNSKTSNERISDTFRGAKGALSLAANLNPTVVAKASLMGAGSSVYGGLTSGQGFNSFNPDTITQAMGDSTKNAWIYQLTNPVMAKIVEKIPFLAPIADKALNASNEVIKNAATQSLIQVLKKLPEQTLRNVARELFESPLETAVSSADKSVNEGANFGEAYKKNFLNDLFSSAVYGVLKTGMETGGSVIKAGENDLGKLNSVIEKAAAKRGMTVPEYKLALQRGSIGLEEDLKPTLDELMKQSGEEIARFDEQLKSEIKQPEPEVKSTTEGLTPQQKEIASDPFGVLETLQNKYNLSEYEAEAVWKDINPNEKLQVDPDKLEQDFIRWDRALADLKEMDVAKLEPVKPESVINTQKPEDDNYIESLLKQGETPNAKKETKTSWVEEMLQRNKQVKDAKSAGDTLEEKYIPKSSKEQFKQDVMSAKTKEDVNMVLEKGKAILSNIKSYIEGKGKSFESVVAELENENITNKSEEANMITRWFDAFKERAEADGVVVPTRQDFFTHLSEQKKQDILNNPSKPDNFGSTIIDPYFAKQRTGKLKDYAVDTDAMLAYAKEAMKNVDLSEAQKAEIKMASDIKQEVRQQTEGKLNSLKTPDIDYASKVKEFNSKFPSDEPKKKYRGGKENWTDKAVRSLDDRVAKFGGDDIYKDFLDPFKRAEIEIAKYGERLVKMSDAELLKTVGDLSGRKLDRKERLDILSRKLYSERKYQMSLAAQEYYSNLSNAEFGNIKLESLVNDIGNEYLSKDIVLDSTAKKLLGKIRAQTGRGALWFNIGSSINNLFETKRLFSTISTKSFSRATQRLAAGEGKDITTKYGIDSKETTALNRKQQGLLSKLDKYGFFLFDQSEKFKDQFMLLGFEEQGKEKGLEGDDLRIFVQKKFSEFAIKYGKGQDIGLFKNDITKTLLQFGQYKVKDMVILIDKLGGVAKGDIGDAKYVAKYTIASVLQMRLMQKLLGVTGFGNQTGTPLDFINDIFSGKAVNSPIVDLVSNFYVYMNEEDDYEKQTALNNLKRTAATMLIPGSNQLWYKTGKYATDMNRGYMETRGGNVANEVSDKPVDNAKGLLFGRSYDPKRQEYIKGYLAGEEPYLSKAESAAYRSLPEDKKTEFYEKSKLNSVKSVQSKKNIKEMTKEPTFLDRLLNKEQKTIETSIPTKNSTTADWKAFRAEVETKIDNDMELTDKEVAAYYFKNKTAKTDDISDREDIYKKLLALDNDEEVSDEIKASAKKVSGVDEDDYQYFKAAKDHRLEVRQRMVDMMLSDAKPEDIMQALAVGRKKIGNVRLTDDDDLSYLYEADLISKEQYDFLKALQYDELQDKYYLKKSYKESGGSGGSGKMTKAELNNYIKINLSGFIKGSNSISNILPKIKTQSTPNTSKKIEEILSYR